MNIYWIGAFALMAVLALWVVRPIREFLLVWAPIGADDLFKKAVPLTVAVLALSLAIAGRLMDSARQAKEGPPAPESITEVGSNTPKVVRAATGQHPVLGPLPATEPEVQRGVKIVVVESSVGRSTTQLPSVSEYVENELESYFRTTGIHLLADKRLRADLINELRLYQQGRALYDPETLKQVQPGHFHGATHGVFWSTGAGDTGPVLEGRVVRLLTSEVVATASARIADDRSMASAVRDVAIALLADIVEVRIESPAGDSVCGRNITVRGRVSYLPKGWTLWITMLPEGLSNHFPQRAATMQRDGAFIASEVYLGDETLVEERRFTVFAVMADEETSTHIRSYLVRPDTSGLDISSGPGRIAASSAK